MSNPDRRSSFDDADLLASLSTGGADARSSPADIVDANNATKSSPTSNKRKRSPSVKSRQQTAPSDAKNTTESGADAGIRIGNCLLPPNFVCELLKRNSIKISHVFIVFGVSLSLVVFLAIFVVEQSKTSVGTARAAKRSRKNAPNSGAKARKGGAAKQSKNAGVAASGESARATRKSSSSTRGKKKNNNHGGARGR